MPHQPLWAAEPPSVTVTGRPARCPGRHRARGATSALLVFAGTLSCVIVASELISSQQCQPRTSAGLNCPVIYRVIDNEESDSDTRDSAYVRLNNSLAVIANVGTWVLSWRWPQGELAWVRPGPGATQARAPTTCPTSEASCRQEWPWRVLLISARSRPSGHPPCPGVKSQHDTCSRRTTAPWT